MSTFNDQRFVYTGYAALRRTAPQSNASGVNDPLVIVEALNFICSVISTGGAVA